MRGALIVALSVCLVLAMAAAAPAQSLTAEEKAELEQVLKDSDIINPEPELGDGDGELRIVRRIAAPADTVIKGLAWQKGRETDVLWVLVDTNPARIFALDENGTELNRFEGLQPGLSGLIFDSRSLRTLDVAERKILIINMGSGAVIKSPQVEIGNNIRIPSGLAWDGTNLWIANQQTIEILKVNRQNGTILKKINAPGAYLGHEPFGLAWDGENIWASNINGVYKLNPSNGDILESYEDPDVSNGHAYALTYGGGHLWVGSALGNGILQIDVGDSNLPTATTNDADENHDSATVSGTVNPNGFDTNYYFEYGETTTFGSRTNILPAGKGTEDVGVEAEVEDLDKDTKYYFRIVAKNTNGTAYGDTANFVTNEYAFCFIGAGSAGD